MFWSAEHARFREIRPLSFPLHSDGAQHVDIMAPVLIELHVVSSRVIKLIIVHVLSPLPPSPWGKRE